MSSLEELHSIADALAVGFESVLQQVERQKRIEQTLRDQLAKAIEQLNSNTSENPSDSALSEWQDEIIKQIEPTVTEVQQNSLESSNEVSEAIEALARLRAGMAVQVVKKRCPVPHVTIDHSALEQDFTTKGKPSSLECPFATISGDSTGLDPIAAEFHQDKSSAQSVGSKDPCKVCPIRFLDKHSPEEVAQYFENHKHEIPRSHQVCVKRYQQNESSIRELDAKYGNLVSMIQGLGTKHKAYLPADDQDASSINEQSSTQAVQQWAQNVETNVQPSHIEQEEEQRQSHFDKPLRDVRVGESPSRPWGISVPMDRPTAPSAIRSMADGENLAEVAEQAKQAGVTKNVDRGQQEHSARRDGAQASHTTRIVFNGPVFFGYSAEEAAQFLQHLGKSATGE